MPHERYLVGSEYGRFFARKANLNLLRRRPDEWRDLQTQTIAQSTIVASAVTPAASTPAVDVTLLEKKDMVHRKVKKRKAEGTNEIDALFAGAGLDGKKTKRAALGLDIDEVTAKDTEKRRGQGDEANVGGMKEIMDAIRTAPAPDKKREKRRKAGGV
jgi:nucleolar protein 9